MIFFLWVSLIFVPEFKQQIMEQKTQIKIQGSLDKKWKDWFEGLDIIYDGNNSILTGNIKDETSLYGIINKIRDLNLKLISVNPSN